MHVDPNSTLTGQPQLPPPQPQNHQWKQPQHLPLRALATTTAPASTLAIFRATYLARISNDFCARLMSTSMNEMTQTESTTNHRLPPTIHPQLPTTTHDHHHHLPACTRTSAQICPWLQAGRICTDTTTTPQPPMETPPTPATKSIGNNNCSSIKSRNFPCDVFSANFK